MKAFKPLTTSFTPSSSQNSLPSSISPRKLTHTQFLLSKALTPSRQRITRSRVTSHTIRFDFQNLRSCSEISRLNLLYAHQHVRSLPFSFSKASMLYELSVIIITDTWHISYRKTFYTLLKVLQRFKAVSTLNLFLSNSLTLDRHAFKSLTTAIQRMKKLNACNIRLHWCPNVSYREIPRLLLPLRYHSLREVTLSFYGDASQINHQSKNKHNKLSHTLRRLYQCRNLGLELDLNTSFRDSDLTDLATQIRKISGLKGFYLKLGSRTHPSHTVGASDGITDQGLLGFLGQVNNLANLTKLLIHFANCQKVSEEGIQQCVTTFFEPYRFEKLSYKFDGFSMSKSTKMLVFAELLERFQDPKDIRLRPLSSPDFALCYTKSKGNSQTQNLIQGEIRLCCDIPPALPCVDYHTFAKAFSQLSNIKKFDFTCRDNAYTWELTQQMGITKSPPMQLPAITNNFLHLNVATDEVIKSTQAASLISLLGRLTHLQGLSLRFSYCAALNEETLVHIMDLLPVLTGLRHLGINFIRCPRATEIVVLTLAKSLGHFKNLENLNFQFEGCKTLTNKATVKLLESIRELILLKNLTLSFQDCLLLTSQSILSLPEALLSLHKLQGLSLVFPGIAEASNTELQGLAGSICGLKELQSLKLDFSNCEEISDGGLCAIGKSVMQIGGIRYLEIYLDNCWKLQNEGIYQTGKFVKTLKQLYSLKMSLKGCVNITAEGVNQLIGELCELEKLEFLTLDFGTGDHVGGEVFHRADVFLKFERMENISVNLRASKDIVTHRVGELRKKLGEVSKVVIFFK